MGFGALFGDIAGGLLGLGSTAMTNAANESLMREQWQREDTAMQRRVTDLEKAGLSKWLAAGTGGASASAPISLESPDYNFVGDAGQHFLSNALTEAQTKSEKTNQKIQQETASAQADAAKAAAREAEANALMAEHDSQVLSKRPYQMRGDTPLNKNISAAADFLGIGSNSGIPKQNEKSSSYQNTAYDNEKAWKEDLELRKKANDAEKERKRKEKEKAKEEAYWAKIHAAGDKAARDANVKWHWNRIFGNNY